MDNDRRQIGNYITRIHPNAKNALSLILQFASEDIEKLELKGWDIERGPTGKANIEFLIKDRKFPDEITAGWKGWFIKTKNKRKKKNA
jgi:hypothetical protein